MAGDLADKAGLGTLASDEPGKSDSCNVTRSQATRSDLGFKIRSQKRLLPEETLRRLLRFLFALTASCGQSFETCLSALL